MNAYDQSKDNDCQDCYAQPQNDPPYFSIAIPLEIDKGYLILVGWIHLASKHPICKILGGRTRSGTLSFCAS